MAESLPQVGAPNAELKNSPIVDEFDFEEQADALSLEYQGPCYFNGKAYAPGTRVCSGSEVLLCTREGLWVRQAELEEPD
jgi:hypothetical protein